MPASGNFKVGPHVVLRCSEKSPCTQPFGHEHMHKTWTCICEVQRNSVFRAVPDGSAGPGPVSAPCLSVSCLVNLISSSVHQLTTFPNHMFLRFVFSAPNPFITIALFLFDAERRAPEGVTSKGRQLCCENNCHNFHYHGETDRRLKKRRHKLAGPNCRARYAANCHKTRARHRDKSH